MADVYTLNPETAPTRRLKAVRTIHRVNPKQRELLRAILLHYQQQPVLIAQAAAHFDLRYAYYLTQAHLKSISNIRDGLNKTISLSLPLFGEEWTVNASMPWIGKETPEKRPASPAIPPLSPPGPSLVTWIPPLIDGACGIPPRAQDLIMTMFRHEACALAKVLPALCWAYLAHLKEGSWTDTLEKLSHVVLAGLEVVMLIDTVVLYLALPGSLFAIWICCFHYWARVTSWILNREGEMWECTGPLESGAMVQERKDEKWMFLSGIGPSTRHVQTSTLPLMTRLFSRPITCINMPTYGLPLDLIMMVLQRCVTLPSQPRRVLYGQLRGALNDSSVKRCVVLAHGHSSILLSQAVAQLCADLPVEKLDKLEIYTFGAAAIEFAIPASHQDQHPGWGVHVEHFAMQNDPFAQYGVLHSVRVSMERRFCGGLFVINNAKGQSFPWKSHCRSRPPLTMEDYLMAIFPAQITKDQVVQSVLDAVMNIDRNCAEAREIKAIEASKQTGTKKGGTKKRLSWTALGATAGMGQGNGVAEGRLGVEIARMGCKGCEGHRGREVSWLFSHVIGAPSGEIANRQKAAEAAKTAKVLQ